MKHYEILYSKENQSYYAVKSRTQIIIEGSQKPNRKEVEKVLSSLKKCAEPIEKYIN